MTRDPAATVISAEAPTASVAQPTFSVVIPTYQRAHLVGRAIRSCLDQTALPIEIVVVDDGSSDDTRSVVEGFGAPVRYVYQDNAGVSIARNRGAGETRGDWIAFLDSDDAFDPSYLETLANAVVATGARADLYFTDAEFPPSPSGENPSFWGRGGFGIGGPHLLVADGADWVMRPRQPIRLQCSIIRRTAYLESGGLLEALRMREDTHFFLRFGIGRPLCAVAGAEVKIGEDDVPENRLTLAYPPDGRVYLEATVVLYADVLRNVEVESRAHRRELRKRLGAARIRAARIDWREHRHLRALRRVAHGIVTCPSNVPGMLARMLRGWWRRA